MDIKDLQEQAYKRGYADDAKDIRVPANCGTCGNYDREKGEFTKACGVCKVMSGGASVPSAYKARKLSRGDCIRAQIATDEGLARLIFKYNLDDYIRFCEERPECVEAIGTDAFDPYGTSCQECLLRYLRQPAEEDKL